MAATQTQYMIKITLNIEDNELLQTAYKHLIVEFKHNGFESITKPNHLSFSQNESVIFLANKGIDNVKTILLFQSIMRKTIQEFQWFNKENISFAKIMRVSDIEDLIVAI